MWSGWPTRDLYALSLVTLTWEQLPLPFATVEACDARERSPLGRFDVCPLCDGALVPEHAHYRCSACGWRDSCCD